MVEAITVGQQLGLNEEDVKMLYLGWKGMKWRPLVAYTNHYWRALFRFLEKYFSALARWAGLGFTVQSVRGVLERVRRLNGGKRRVGEVLEKERRKKNPRR